MTDKFKGNSAPTRILKDKKTVPLDSNKNSDETVPLKNNSYFDEEDKISEPEPVIKPPTPDSKSTQPKTTVIGRAGSKTILVTGWLVIIDGPGKGHSVELASGNQTIGRDISQDIVLDFNDGNISREQQAIIEYNVKDNQFVLIPNDKAKNRSRLNGEALYSAKKLKNKDIITLGDTELCFVAFCDKDFYWEKKDKEEKSDS